MEERDACKREGWGPRSLEPCYILGMEVLDNLPHDRLQRDHPRLPWFQTRVLPSPPGVLPSPPGVLPTPPGVLPTPPGVLPSPTGVLPPALSLPLQQNSCTARLAPSPAFLKRAEAYARARFFFLRLCVYFCGEGVRLLSCRLRSGRLAWACGYRIWKACGVLGSDVWGRGEGESYACEGEA